LAPAAHCKFDRRSQLLSHRDEPVTDFSDVVGPPGVTRRDLLARGAALGLGSTLGGLAAAPPALAARRRPIGLPTPRQVRAEFTRMVEFGPRLTGSEAHANYIAWLEQEFAAAGLSLLFNDPDTTDRWLAQQVGLDLLEGSAAGP